MTRPLFTAALVAATAIGLIGYDIWAASDGVPGNTITEVTIAAMKGRPFVSFLLGFSLGFICGHLFWQLHY